MLQSGSLSQVACSFRVSRSTAAKLRPRTFYVNIKRWESMHFLLRAPKRFLNRKGPLSTEAFRKGLSACWYTQSRYKTP